MGFIPNTTPTPNWLYNGEMRKMNETELKVVLLVTRKTLGWFDPMTNDRKVQDNISQKQFMEFTGKSNRAIATAIQDCVEHGWIIARDQGGELCDTPEKRARRKVWYQLGNIFTKKISGEETSQDENKSKSGEHFSKSGEHNDTNLVNIVHSTKETITKETKQKKVKAKQEVLPINAFIELFKDLNPSYEQIFKNKTQRQAVERLLKKYGEEKVENMVEAAKNCLGKPYAPTITTPLLLEQKLGNLMAYYQRENNNSHKVIKI